MLNIKKLEQETGNSKWYYYIDFGYGVKVGKEHRRSKTRGYRNWTNMLSGNLPDLKDCRILDIGCNAGIYDLEMYNNGAAAVVGIDFDTKRAEFVKKWYQNRWGRDYSEVKFISTDVRSCDLVSLGKFDLACMFSVVYHLGDCVDAIFQQLAKITDTIILQGNLARLTLPKYRNRKYQELAGIDGMVDLLKNFGFGDINVIAPEGYDRPLVMGRKK